MERRTQNLTLKLLILEITADRRTLTDEAARDLLLLFPRESVWRVDIRKIETAGPSVGSVKSIIHYEMQLVHRTIMTGYSPSRLAEANEAIEALCQDFCDPAGVLSPRQVNPNPHLVFTVGVDVSNPIDDVFLRSFPKHSSRNDGIHSGAGNAKGIAGWGDAVARATPSLLHPVCKAVIDVLKISRGQDLPVDGNITSRAGAAATLIAVLEQSLSSSTKDGNSGDTSQRTTTALDQAILSFAVLDNACANYGATGAIDLPGLTRSYLESLRDSMSVITEQQGHAKLSLGKAKHAGTVCAVVFITALLAFGRHMLSPNPGANLTSGVAQLLQLVSAGSFTGGLGVATEAAKTRDAAGKLRDANLAIHRMLYLMAHDALRSDYRHRPDAAVFARLALDMAALINPASLDHWEDRYDSSENMDRDLRFLVKTLTDQCP